MYQMTIKRTALGRVAQIGDLYDVTTDSFVHDSLFSKKLDEGSVDTTELGDTSVEKITSDSLKGDDFLVSVSAELELSVMSGLIKISGSGAYVNDKKNSKRSQRMSLVYTMRTVNENLKIRYHSDDINRDLFKGEGNPVATHVVVGIDYGAICSATCICENNEGKDEITVKGELMAKFEKVEGPVGANAKAEAEYKSKEVKNDEKFHFTYESSVSSSREPLPLTFEDAVQMAKSLPKLIKATKEGKGVPLHYMMMPLNTAAKICHIDISHEWNFDTIGEDTITQCTHALGKLTGIKQKLFDIKRDLSAHREYIEEGRLKRISECVNEVDLEILKFRAELQEHILNVRRKDEKLEKLEEFLAKDLPAKCEPHIGEFEKDIKRVTLVKEWMRRGIIYLGKSDLFIVDDMEVVYVYYCNQPGNKFGTETGEEIGTETEDYFHRCQNDCSKNTKIAFKVVDLSIRDGSCTDGQVELYIKGTKVTKSNHKEYSGDKFFYVEKYMKICQGTSPSPDPQKEEE